jgi:hypothetical protein
MHYKKHTTQMGHCPKHFYTCGQIPLFALFPALISPLSISHYAPFTTPRGMHITTQHTDNQSNNFTNTPNALQKHTTQMGHCPKHFYPPAGNSRSSLSFPL